MAKKLTVNVTVVMTPWRKAGLIAGAMWRGARGDSEESIANWCASEIAKWTVFNA